MKLQILSDIHIEFESFDPPKVDADVIILAGDIHIKNKGILWAKEKFPDKPVLYVLGNHEYYGEAYPRYLDKLKNQVIDTNINILENESIEISGIKFLCCTLWTDFNLFGNPRISGYEATKMMTDFRRIRVNPTYRKLRSIDTVRIHHNSINWLKNEVEKNTNETLVIITHHAPSQLSIPEYYRENILSPAYASHLDEFVKNSKAKLWVHGHVHTQNDYFIGDTRVVCNPRAYPNERNNEFMPGLLIEV